MNAPGHGVNDWKNIKLRWQHGADQVDPAQAAVRTYAIPMVYVPEGPFRLGSGGLELNGFYEYTDGVNNLQPYKVTSAGPIPTGRQAGRLWAWRAAQPEDGGDGKQ